MAQYFKVDNDTWIKYDNGKTFVLKKSELLTDKDAVEELIVRLKKTDGDLLLWAKEHYPKSREYEELPSLENKVVEINNDLKAMK